MLTRKNIILLNSTALLFFIVFKGNAFEAIQSKEREVLEVYDLCLAFETMYKKIDEFEAYITFLAKEGDQYARIKLSTDQMYKLKELTDQVLFLKENKNILINSSFDELQQIKLKLKNTLEEIRILKQNAIKQRLQQIASQKYYPYKEWVKLILKLVINRVLINYVQEIPIFAIPVSISQIYYSIQFGFSTCCVIGDISERIAKKIW